MSYSHTFIVPQDPNFVPSDEQAARGKDLLDKKLGGDYAPAIIYKSHTPRLYSTEENWTSFTCPRCKKLVRYTSQLSHWWYTSLYGLCKPDEIQTVPCCNSEIAGKEFDFGEDAVFSLFALTVGEVDIIESGYFTQEDIHALEASLGFKMRIIIAKGT